MNEDEAYARVRIRKRVIPLLEELNPRAVENIARATTLFRDDLAALQDEAKLLLEKATMGSPPGNSNQTDSFEIESVNPFIKVSVLVGAPAALRRRAIRLWLAQLRGNLRRIERVHLLAVDRLLDSGRGGRLAELPGGARVERRRGFLIFQEPKTIENDRVEV
jgi:tRNA(Ile)-lysidine synthase